MADLKRTIRRARRRMKGGMRQWGPLVGLGVLAIFAVAVVGVALTPDRQAPAATSRVAPSPAPTASKLPTAVFMGDSYTQGVGASTVDKRWTSVLSVKEGWQEVNLGRGGTGYVTTSTSCGLPACPAYPAMVADAVAAKPQTVVVSGGQNDFAAYSKDPAAVEAAVRQVFQKLRAALPDVKIVAVGPSTPYGLEKTVTALDASVQREAHAVGAAYVSLISPNVVAPEMLTADRSHVNDSGHAAIAKAVAPAMG